MGALTPWTRAGRSGDDQELRDFATDHIYYELLMLHETAIALKWRENLDADFALKNAFIESFTIHARVLALFLYKGPKWDDDVTAEQYVRAVQKWRAARGRIPVDLQEVIDRTGKEIAHLTRGRTSSPRPEEGLDHRARLPAALQTAPPLPATRRSDAARCERPGRSRGSKSGWTRLRSVS